MYFKSFHGWDAIKSETLEGATDEHFTGRQVCHREDLRFVLL